MPSLSQYINFSVLFDSTGSAPVLTLADISSYPSGLPSTIQGNFSITQPDGITRKNTAAAPDIEWNGAALNIFSIPLRLDCNNNLQYGTYTIAYSVIDTSNTYSSGILTRTFIFTLSPVIGKITSNFDVFTPLLSATDSTNYEQGGFNDTENRTFTGLIQSENITVSTPGTVLSLLYNGSYWDSLYTLTINTIVTYTHATYSWLSAKINVYATLTTSANTPPACNIMINQLADYEAALSPCGCDSAEERNLINAKSLLNQINTNLGLKNYDNLYNTILAFENIVTYGQYNYQNTGNVIAAYNYNCGSSGSSSGAPVGTTTISFVVGDPGYEYSGLNTVTFASLAPVNTNTQTIVTFSKGGTTEIPALNYQFNDSTGQITLLGGDIFNNGEQIYIFALYNKS